MIIATDPKHIPCLNPKCSDELGFDTDQVDFVCENHGHRFSTDRVDGFIKSGMTHASEEAFQTTGTKEFKHEVLESPPALDTPPPVVEVLEALPVRSAAPEKRPEEVKAIGIPVRRLEVKPREFGDGNGNRWTELPNGDVLVSLVIPQHHASALRATVEGGQWAGGDPLRYFVETVIGGFENGLFWIFLVGFTSFLTLVSRGI